VVSEVTCLRIHAYTDLPVNAQDLSSRVSLSEAPLQPLSSVWRGEVKWQMAINHDVRYQSLPSLSPYRILVFQSKDSGRLVSMDAQYGVVERAEEA